MENKLRVSSSPHIRSKETVSGIMKDVLIAMAPAAIAAVYFFGLRALWVMIASVATAVLTEWAIQKFMYKKVTTITDYSAAVTGLLLAFNLPVSAPWYLPVIGSCFAIAIAKQVFGGLGHNFINPALAARAFLMASWPTAMTTGWVAPFADATTSATPLAILKQGLSDPMPSLMDAFLGSVGGCIGETSALLILLGGIYLIYKGIIDWRVPATFIGTVFVMSLFFYGFDFKAATMQILLGGVFLGAFFMATDYSSSPVTPMGQWIFAIGCGLITTIVRFKGGYPEGVSYSILLMNVATPLIEKYTAQRVFGGSKK